MPDVILKNVLLVFSHCCFAIALSGAGVFKFGGTICQLTESRSEINYAAKRSGDSPASIEKLRGAGFAPASSFTDGLKTMLNFFQKKQQPAGPMQAGCFRRIRKFHPDFFSPRFVCRRTKHP